MPSAAAARRALGRRARRAVDIAHRKRRSSHRGYPDLHQTHTIPVGGSVDVTQAFTRPAQAVTFKFRVDRVSDSANGEIVTLGDQGSIGFLMGMLRVDTGNRVFSADFIADRRDSAEIVVALRPVDGQVRAWIDSNCAIAGTAATFPYSWATSGTLDYDSIVGAVVGSDLDVFELQLPRHFDECPDTTATDFCPLLFRAARATYQIDEHPFLGEH